MTTPIKTPTRRSALKALAVGAVGAVAASLPLWARYTQAQSAEPIRIGFQQHRTGIGAAYGRWDGRATEAAVGLINAGGGINGRPIEIVAEDDGTDPKRGAEVIEKFVNQHGCDVGFGTLFSHVVIGSAPRAGELKLPYFVVSEGTHVSSGMLNRYTLQSGITDVRSQVIAMVPFITDTPGKKVPMIFPDYGFGYDHRDALGPAVEAQGGEVLAKIAIPPCETSFTKYFPKIPRDTEVLYHVMVGPAVLTFAKKSGEFFGGQGPELFGFIDGLGAVAIDGPGLDFLEGRHFWEGMCRHQQPDETAHQALYREAAGVDARGASVNDPADVSTYGHMFGCWETLHVIKAGMEAAGYRGPQDRAALIEAVEAMTEMPLSREHPQGAKRFNGKTHQVFGHRYISQVQNGTLTRVHTTAIEDPVYPDMVDNTTQAL